MVDEAMLLKVQELIAARQRIDRELTEIFNGNGPKRGRPRKDEPVAIKDETTKTEPYVRTGAGPSEG